MKDSQLLQVKGKYFPVSTLKVVLPTPEQALWFAKLYKLDVQGLSTLLATVFKGMPLIDALLNEGNAHSSELQDYILGLNTIVLDDVEMDFTGEIPDGVLLPQLWESMEVEVADSIQQVADKLRDVVAGLPGKEGNMLFQSLRVMNARRPTLGDYKARIHHAPALPNLVVLDVSGSMTEATVGQILEDVVALTYMADAHLAIVSNTAPHWLPGGYTVEAVLKEAEFGGTHYEELAYLFDQDWGVVVTIADYDSSPAAKYAIAQCKGRIEQLLDISLVNRTTYLAEVLGQLAENVRPLLIAAPGADLCY